MTGPTHIAFAGACILTGAAFYSWEVPPGALVAVAIGSLLPDLDTPKSMLGRFFWFIASPLEKAVGHRGLTHSLLCIPLYLLLCLPLWFLNPIWAYALFGGVVSHLAIDTVTKQGIKAFWPNTHDLVLFHNDDWRMEVGSLAERLLLIGLIVAIGVLIPVSKIGMPQLWAQYVGDLGRAINKYRELEGQRELWLKGKLKDNTTEQRLEGRWRAIGTAGPALLILVEDSVRSVGTGEGHNLRPQHVHLEQGEPLQTSVVMVAAAGQALSMLSERIPSSGEHWLIGELTLAAPLIVAPTVGRYAVVKAANQTLALDHARWRDIEALGPLLVTSGDVILKYRGSQSAMLPDVHDTSGQMPTVAVPVTLDLKRMSDLQVDVGDELAIGQALATDSQVNAELDAIRNKIAAEQMAFLKGVPAHFDRLYRDEVIDRHEFLRFQTAQAKVTTAVSELRVQREQLESQHHVISQLAGKVTTIRIKQQRGGTLTVELLIATPALQRTAPPPKDISAAMPRRSTARDAARAEALPGAPSGNTKIKDFNAAKRVVAQLYKGHELTLYCGCRYQGSRIDWASCGYVPRKDRKRAVRLEWEHVVPAHAFGQSFPEWQNGHPACGRKKGRKCVGKVRPDFRLMEADLYNLQPAVGEVNGRRSNYSMAMLPGEAREFGACDVEIDKRKVEPRPSVRGDIARTYWYMDWAYPGRGIVSGKNRKLFEVWAAADPVDAWELERARRIAKLQGNRNPFVLDGALPRSTRRSV